MAGEEGGIWAMPEDQTTVDGISTLPQADYLTPMRVENTMVEYMVQRGIISGRCFGGFVYDLAGRTDAIPARN